MAAAITPGLESSPLLALPVELQCLIYEFVLGDDGLEYGYIDAYMMSEIRVKSMSDQRERINRGIRTAHLQLALTCKAVNINSSRCRRDTTLALRDHIYATQGPHILKYMDKTELSLDRWYHRHPQPLHQSLFSTVANVKFIFDVRYSWNGQNFGRKIVTTFDRRSVTMVVMSIKDKASEAEFSDLLTGYGRTKYERVVHEIMKVLNTYGWEIEDTLVY